MKIVKAKMATTDRFDGFTVNMHLDEGGDWLAHFAEMPGVSAFAATPEAALGELAQAWAGVRLSYEKRGEPVPVAPARREGGGGWPPGLREKTAGAWQGEPLERAPQGDGAQRLLLD
jgi:predicted RNase H-like HicB family nuclease